MSFLLDNCRFSNLTADLIKKCQPFCCSKNPDINDFFHSEFEDYNNQLLGKSYCFVTLHEPHQIVCAFTVSNASIRVKDLPNKRRNKINRSIPYVKHRPQYPAVLLGQLAVFDSYMKHGIGSELMGFIKGWFIDPFNKTGCRYIIVDAINYDKVLAYYLKNGFECLFSSDDEEMAYMSNAYEEGFLNRIKTFFSVEVNSKEIYRKTRLMMFDLIVLRSNKK